MIERACDIVEMPDGGLAALMPIPDLSEKHWVVVEPGQGVLHATGRIHRDTQSQRIANRPWLENWKPLGRREIVLLQPDQDFDTGGGD